MIEKYNIRDYPECAASGFIKVHQLRDHILAQSEILPRDRERRFIPPKEHFEFVEEQQELLAIAAVCAEPTPPPGVPEFLKDILNHDGSDNGHSARDRAMEKDEFSRHHDRHICDSNPREIYDESLSGEPFRDNTNSPALQVLKYSCRTLFNVDLDATDELEQFEQDNLVEIVEDFVEQLKNTFDATTSWTNQQTSSSTQQRSETRSGPKALREHLRDHHKRVDGALFVCVRCFQGFRDKPSHDQHAREDPLCIIEDWKAHHKLGLEGSLLPRPSGSPEEQWREICCSVLRSADANVSPDYAAVIEHFELSQELYRGIPDLISSILGTETYMYTSHDIGKFLEWREEKFQLGQQEGSPEESDLPSSELANGQVLRVFSIIREHYNKVFAGLEESRKAMPYENNQSRDRGGVKSRRPGGAVERGIPTPMSDQSPSALTPGMSSDGNGEYHHRSKGQS
ncbi:unnamed protein product [Parascedosporium putredinis]|uniref:Uncharacterized protein n=1 Tax=Parascedosporium putredinis TaxID=1442378 RepID=A0A9P1M7Z5_9PEZI|nr:unnamed protein product [Parascedosporium putredinis]CAI7991571.1 unnamed protein product [Parascedosporium putredinis]